MAGSAKFSEFRTLLPFIAKHRARYIPGLCCLIIVDAAQVFIPQWTRRIINIIQYSNCSRRDVLVLCAGMVGTMAVISIGRFLWRYFIHGASRRIEAELREMLFSHLLLLDSGFYQKNKTGDLIARTTNDIAAVRMAIGWGIVAGIDGTVMAAGILIVIFMQSPEIAALAVIPVPFITMLIVLFGRAVGRRFKGAQEAYSVLSESVQESLSGVRVIKSFVREAHFISKFSGANNNYVNANMSVVRVHGLFFPLILFLAGITTLIVLFTGGRAVAHGTMLIGDLVSLVAYIQMLVWPMFGAGFTVNMIQRGAVSMARINEILWTKPVIMEPEGVKHSVIKTSENDSNGSSSSIPVIELRNLTFSYPDGTTALKNINLKINKGEWLGIFGRTGAGKSTLVKLLPRLLEAPEGTVFVDGFDVQEQAIAALRSKFGMAPQDSFLFSDTIKNNISYGKTMSALAQSYEYNGVENNEDSFEYQARLKSLIALSGLEKDLALFKDELQTQIGERGLTLSGGQKQRVTIARALFVEPEILVLDDSLSACDLETEKAILSRLEAARRGKTTIIISHRISAFRVADNVAVLEDGALIEYGSPSLLISNGGYYSKTAGLQKLAVSR
ncbi:MAG: ABC transporter ATP-binding protein [Termitinemataceae bacterium]|nr:MAG: ABC transporter ATP-binding protein [Termitinemataceae bacterium]